jgi:cytochrome bd-type quinol oxidase subunit 2
MARDLLRLGLAREGQVEAQNGNVKKWLSTTPPSVWAMIMLIAVALIGGIWTINATAETSRSAEAIATVMAAVVGVAGVHIGHVTGHQRGRPSWPRWSAWLGFLIILLAMIVFAVVLLTITGSKPNWSAEAIATVVAAVVGVAGTHIGHVTGHQLGQAVRPGNESGGWR